MGFPRGAPLADLPGSLARYSWPDPDDERIVQQIYDRPGVDQEETFLCGSHRDTLWEKCYMLVGMENAMCYFHTEPDAMREVLHRIMDFQLGIARHYLRLGVELVGLSDDLGTQCGLLLSPALISDFLEPEYRRLFALYRPRGVLIISTAAATSNRYWTCSWSWAWTSSIPCRLPRMTSMPFARGRPDACPCRVASVPGLSPADL